MVEAGTAELSDIIPVHVFCEATYEEVEKALIKDVRLPQLISSPKGGKNVDNNTSSITTTDAVTTRSRKRAASRKKGKQICRSALVYRALDAVDSLVRDATFDPFHRQHGRIIGTNHSHKLLLSLCEEWGPAMADLVVVKKEEIEKFCPSGHYPTPVLWKEGKEVTIGAVVRRLVEVLRETRNTKDRDKVRKREREQE